MPPPVPPDPGFSLRKTVKGLKRLVVAPRPSALVPVLQFVVQVSPAFPPLQSAAGGLLKVIEIVEVRPVFSFLSPAYRDDRSLFVFFIGSNRRQLRTQTTLPS